jgi:hypothetical protein
MLEIHSRRAILTVSAIVLLVGCAGGSSLSPRAVAPDAAHARAPGGSSEARAEVKTPKKLTFASDDASPTTGVVYAYDRAGSDQSPLFGLTDGLEAPAGLYVGSAPHADLYVANEGLASIAVFGAPSYGTQNFSYADPGQLPASVAQCGNFVYAGNVLNTAGTAGSATAWNLGNATATGSVSNANYSNVTGVACDEKTGTVYVGFLYSYAGPAGIDAYSPGLSGSATSLAGVPASSSCGLTVDQRNGDIVLCDGGTIDFYDPVKRAVVKEVSGFDVPAQVAFEKSDAIMWVADYGTNALYRVRVSSGARLDVITKPGFTALGGTATVPADH